MSTLNKKNISSAFASLLDSLGKAQENAAILKEFEPELLFKHPFDALQEIYSLAKEIKEYCIVNLEDLEAHYEDLSLDLQKLAKKIEVLEKDNTELMDSSFKQKTTIKDLQGDINVSRTERVNLENNLNTAKTHLITLQKKLEDQENKISKGEIETNNLKERIKKQEEELNTLKNKIFEKERGQVNQGADLEKKFLEFKRDLEKKFKINKHEELEKRINALEKSNSELSSNLNTLTAKHQRTEEWIDYQKDMFLLGDFAVQFQKALNFILFGDNKEELWVSTLRKYLNGTLTIPNNMTREALLSKLLQFNLIEDDLKLVEETLRKLKDVRVAFAHPYIKGEEKADLAKVAEIGQTTPKITLHFHVSQLFRESTT